MTCLASLKQMQREGIPRSGHWWAPGLEGDLNSPLQEQLPAAGECECVGGGKEGGREGCTDFRASANVSVELRVRARWRWPRPRFSLVGELIRKLEGKAGSRTGMEEERR